MKVLFLYLQLDKYPIFSPSFKFSIYIKYDNTKSFIEKTFMRNLMKHVWILFLSPSTTASLPMSSHSLHVEWHRFIEWFIKSWLLNSCQPQAFSLSPWFKICFDGEFSLSTTCPPQFYIWWFLYAMSFPHHLDSYYFWYAGELMIQCHLMHVSSSLSWSHSSIRAEVTLFHIIAHKVFCLQT